MPTCGIYAQLAACSDIKVALVIMVILIKVTFIILIICRQLVASRDVKPGEVVVVESSLILVPGMQVSFNSIIVLFFNFF